MPASAGRSSGTSAAAPPQAASTCSQSPSSAQTSASSASGSMTPALVVPAVADHQEGVCPASRSAAMPPPQVADVSRCRASSPTSRTASVPRPGGVRALTKESWAWSET